MNSKRSLLIVLPLVALLVAGCGQFGSNDSSGSHGMLSGIADMARKKIAEQNIEIGGDSGLPKAELTPQGDLLIDGRKIAANANQHALLLKYRQLLESIAVEGVDVGVQGANLAGKAVHEALSSAVSGKSKDTEDRVKSDAEKVKASARTLCEKLPALLSSQQELAAALPEFRPYARMTAADMKDCNAS